MIRMADCSPVFNGLLFPYCKSLLYLTAVFIIIIYTKQWFKYGTQSLNKNNKSDEND